VLLCVWVSAAQDEDTGNENNGGERDKYEVLKEEYCGSHNCYEVLEVTQDTEFREIKRRYNNLSLALHPDKNPNQTAQDKERYVRINKAYEILSSRRRDYDEYLRIKSSFDSPVESPILVLFLLYLGVAYVVLYYQRQQQQQCKEAILKNPQVVRYYWDEKNIDLTGKRKSKAKGKGKKGKVKDVEQTLCQIKENIDTEQLNEVIAKLNLLVPGYKDTEPTYQQACLDIFGCIVWLAKALLDQVRWFVKYKVLRQSYTDEDREYLCRKYHKKTELEWISMPQEDRKRLLNKNGVWKRKDNKKTQ